MAKPKKEPDAARVLAKLDEIEAEMKAIGFWTDSEEKRDVRYLEGPLEEWLQFSFLPMARENVKNRDWPEKSMVGVRAMRQWDYHGTYEEALPLIKLCHEFDDLVLARA